MGGAHWGHSRRKATGIPGSGSLKAKQNDYDLEHLENILQSVTPRKKGRSFEGKRFQGPHRNVLIPLLVGVGVVKAQ